jgi:hypothetical protein
VLGVWTALWAGSVSDCGCDMEIIGSTYCDVLRSIPKEAFADSFQKLYERCQPCVVKDGDYFEGQ